jgi:hypothetical protein
VAERGKPDIGQDDCQQHEPEAEHGARIDAEQLADQPVPDQQHGAAERREPERDGDAAEHDDPADVARRQAPAGVEPIAHGTAAGGREANRVADRDAGERDERNPVVGKVAPGVADAERIESGQADEARGREQRAEPEIVRRDRPQRLEDRMQAVAVQDPPDQERREPEGSRADPWVEALQPARRPTHSSCFVAFEGAKSRRPTPPSPGHGRAVRVHDRTVGFNGNRKSEAEDHAPAVG